MVSAHYVEREIRSQLGHLGEAKLHKLLYYCQAYHCTWLESEMFSEEIEAWGMGPVVADLWRDKKYGRPTPAPSNLDESAKGIVAFVVATYGHMTGQALIAQTHREAPWKNVYTRLVNHEISPAAMEKYFSTSGPRAATLHWLDQFRKDPHNADAPELPAAPAGPHAPDSLDELRRRRDALAVR